MSVIKKLTYAVFLVIVNNYQLAFSGRKKEDKYVGFDKSNQTIGYSYYPNSKESSEKILKGIWLVLGIFFLVALFLLCRFLYKASSVLCLHKQGNQGKQKIRLKTTAISISKIIMRRWFTSLLEHK